MAWYESKKPQFMLLVLAITVAFMVTLAISLKMRPLKKYHLKGALNVTFQSVQHEEQSVLMLQLDRNSRGDSETQNLVKKLIEQNTASKYNEDGDEIWSVNFDFGKIEEGKYEFKVVYKGEVGNEILDEDDDKTKHIWVNDDIPIECDMKNTDVRYLHLRNRKNWQLDVTCSQKALMLVHMIGRGSPEACGVNVKRVEKGERRLGDGDEDEEEEKTYPFNPTTNAYLYFGTRLTDKYILEMVDCKEEDGKCKEEDDEEKKATCNCNFVDTAILQEYVGLNKAEIHVRKMSILPGANMNQNFQGSQLHKTTQMKLNRNGIADNVFYQCDDN